MAPTSATSWLSWLWCGGLWKLKPPVYRGASPPTTGAKKARKELSQAKAALPGPAALDVLCEMFHLSPFERDVTLMCAGMELDASFPSLCAAASGDPGRNYPTLSLALTVFPDPHWSALTPAAPLRHWRLIELGSGESLTVSTLRLDERISSLPHRYTTSG